MAYSHKAEMETETKAKNLFLKIYFNWMKPFLLFIPTIKNDNKPI